MFIFYMIYKWLTIRNIAVQFGKLAVLKRADFPGRSRPGTIWMFPENQPPRPIGENNAYIPTKIPKVRMMTGQRNFHGVISTTSRSLSA